MAFMRTTQAPLPKREITVEEFKAWLKQFDSDRDGRISKEELQQALRSLHAWSTWWKTREGMKVADVNRNGQIEKEEIEKLVNYANKHLHMKICA
ncbi:hypothetical protein QJS04_geneDACA021736 [Acorus gramineus]|uniref:EF-hand domain-containing protein n=1 Tax=Acorus gramineus TaxID=55184 RepID=A0AAV9AHE9_ACOGR|nr:hypothetical protein QJS04_geneDACA021736 [Acorus gramineus]